MLERRDLLAIDHVVHISVDGLSGSLLEPLVDNELATEAGLYANFARLQSEGASTYNARTDYTHTTTLPNHASMITGRPVSQPVGQSPSVPHNWTINTDPSPGVTLHNNHRVLDYVASTFDVVHDAGLSTAMYAGKTKFSLFDVSYDDNHGAPDTNPAGGDNGRDKIDVVDITADSSSLVDDFVSALSSRDYHYSFVHLIDPDSTGHVFGWGSSQWLQSVQHTDRLIGQIMRTVDGDAELAQRTAIIVTADHGGTGLAHGNAINIDTYRIPFFLWGPGIDAGSDLYELFAASTMDPGNTRPDYRAPRQPIRNGDSGNLALSLLGLPTIPGSTIDSLLAENIEPESSGGLVRLRLAVVDSTGTPVSRVYAGTEFALLGFVEDLRDEPLGVTSAYVDVLFDAAVVGSSGPIVFGTGFGQRQSGSIQADGVVNEIGASLAGGVPRPGELLLFRIPFTANSRGLAHFTIRPADLPGHSFELSGRSRSVSIEDVQLHDARVQVISFANSREPLDVNNDTAVTPLDALLIINDLNSFGAGRLVDLFPDFGSDHGFVDVNADGYVSPLDVLLVINHLNAAVVSTGPRRDPRALGGIASGQNDSAMRSTGAFALLHSGMRDLRTIRREASRQLPL